MPDLTVDNNTAASSPGRIPINRLQWFRCYPKWPLIWGLSFLFFLGLALFIGWEYWLVTAPLLIMNGLYWIRIKEHFRSGDLCTAVVISIRPLIMAVGTDLSKGRGCYPAIKVMKVPSASLSREQKVIGTRVATVALYSRGEGLASRWADFHPRPVGAATTDGAIIKAAFDRIPAALWDDFDQWRQCVAELRPGLHHVYWPG